jgi:hypothetical protein
MQSICDDAHREEDGECDRVSRVNLFGHFPPTIALACFASCGTQREDKAYEGGGNGPRIAESSRVPKDWGYCCRRRWNRWGIRRNSLGLRRRGDDYHGRCHDDYGPSHDCEHVDDKETILEAIKTTKLETILGPVDMTQPVDQNPFDPKGTRPTANIAKPIMTGQQWVKGAKWPYETVVVDNSLAPMVPAVALQPMKYA